MRSEGSEKAGSVSECIFLSENEVRWTVGKADWSSKASRASETTATEAKTDTITSIIAGMGALKSNV